MSTEGKMVTATSPCWLKVLYLGISGVLHPSESLPFKTWRFALGGWPHGVRGRADTGTGVGWLARR